MMENKITSSDRKKITRDWAALFPEFSVYKPMHLLKRNGPFLCGIYLQTYTSNMDYEPLFHIHNLMVEFPIIYLGTNTFLLNAKKVKDSVTLSRHNAELGKIIDRLKEQCLLLQKKSLHLNELVLYMDEFLRKSTGYDYYTLRDVVLALFWCQKKDKAMQRMLNYKDIIATWPEGAKNRFGGEAGWEKQILALMDKSKLKQVVDVELQKHGLSHIQDYGFMSD